MVAAQGEDHGNSPFPVRRRLAACVSMATAKPEIVLLVIICHFFVVKSFVGLLPGGPVRIRQAGRLMSMGNEDADGNADDDTGALREDPLLEAFRNRIDELGLERRPSETEILQRRIDDARSSTEERMKKGLQLPQLPQSSPTSPAFGFAFWGRSPSMQSFRILTLSCC